MNVKDDRWNTVKIIIHAFFTIWRQQTTDSAQTILPVTEICGFKIRKRMRRQNGKRRTKCKLKNFWFINTFRKLMVVPNFVANSYLNLRTHCPRMYLYNLYLTENRLMNNFFVFWFYGHLFIDSSNIGSIFWRGQFYPAQAEVNSTPMVIHRSKMLKDYVEIHLTRQKEKKTTAKENLHFSRFLS